MSKILKNTTAIDIELTVLGVDIPANSFTTINVDDYIVLANDDSITEISPLITSGDIIVNNGTSDLSSIDGINYIKYPDNSPNIRFLNNADNANGFVSNNVQSAIEEIDTKVKSYTSSTVTFGRKGNADEDTWLLRTDKIPSNKTGVIVHLNNAVIRTIGIANRKIRTFDIEIYEHDGDATNLVLLTTISVVSARNIIQSVNIPVATGKHIAAMVSSGEGKDIGIDIQLRGEI